MALQAQPPTPQLSLGFAPRLIALRKGHCEGTGRPASLCQSFGHNPKNKQRLCQSKAALLSFQRDKAFRRSSAPNSDGCSPFSRAKSIHKFLGDNDGQRSRAAGKTENAPKRRRSSAERTPNNRKTSDNVSPKPSKESSLFTDRAPFILESFFREVSRSNSTEN